MNKKINYFKKIFYGMFFYLLQISSFNLVKNVALIGLGPHAKRIYYPYLEKIKNVNLELLVDLDCNKDHILQYIKLRKLQPKILLFLSSETQINPSFISEEVLSYLKKGIVTHAILSSEPKSHKVYLEAFIKYKIQILVDKPITIFDELTHNNVIQLERDIEYLNNFIQQNDGSRVLIQCQRRNHAGYIYISNLLSNIIDNYNIPMTYINIHHSDGMWNMPDEFKMRENHPYKYGYGKLARSGYHFIDLLAILLKLNLKIKNKKPDTISIFSQSIRPFDHSIIINSELISHISSVKLLSKLYLNRIKENNNEIPFSKYKIEDIFNE